MDQEEILKLIENISPHARDYVYNAFENKAVEILYSILANENKGAFIKVENEDCCIFYASFLNEDNIDEVLEIIDNKINEYISKDSSKELCFNIYGNNLKIIDLAGKLGFKPDMIGYHLEYIGEELPQLKNESVLTDKGFESSMLEKFVHLFTSAYYQLSIDNGWDPDALSLHKEQFNRKLNNLCKNGQVCSFWLNDELIGAYIFEENYITDIVVNPRFQGKGYGSYMLAHCIRNMSRYMSINNSNKAIRLRVAKSNIGAKKLYERNNFIEIAYFAEHTYERSKQYET